MHHNMHCSITRICPCTQQTNFPALNRFLHDQNWYQLTFLSCKIPYSQTPFAWSHKRLNFVRLFYDFQPNYCSFFPPNTQKCVSVPTHLAESRRLKRGPYVTSELWVLSMELVSCYPSGAQNLEVDHRVLENFLFRVVKLACLLLSPPILDARSISFSICNPIFYVEIPYLSLRYRNKPNSWQFMPFRVVSPIHSQLQPYRLQQ